MLSKNDQMLKDEGYKDFDDFVRKNVKVKNKSDSGVHLKDGQ